MHEITLSAQSPILYTIKYLHLNQLLITIAVRITKRHNISPTTLKVDGHSRQKSQSRSEKLKPIHPGHYENKLNCVAIVIISASHLAPAIHILVVMVS